MIIHSTTLDTEDKVKAIYGGNTWVKIEGRFLLGQSASYAINAVGGEATHKLTVAEMPAHNHQGIFQSLSSKLALQQCMQMGESMTVDFNSTGTIITPPTNGGNAAHNNMPPYKVVYIWERTA